MTYDIRRALADLTEQNVDYEAAETFSKVISVFIEEAGLKYGEDFILNGTRDGKLHFSFADRNSLNLALKTLAGE